MATAKEISNRYGNDLTTFLTAGTQAEGRDAYLAWVAKWKAQYRELSRDIADVKNKRKPYRYEYRAKGEGDKGVKRRTKIGDNPNYESGPSWNTAFALSHLRWAANHMLQARKDAKAAAAARCAEQREAA